MQILWKGQACFHVVVQRNKQEQVKIVIDPYDASLGLRVPSLEADIVLVSHDHFDHNNVKAVRGVASAGGDSPFIISTPGEYEIKDVFIQGIPSFHDDVQGKERGKNTIFVIDAEGMRICHLGDLGQAELTADQVGQVGNVDILLIPVGGVYTIGGKAASKIVNQIEPRMAIPMHYALPNLKVKLEKVDEFLHEMGVKDAEKQGKLSLKARDLTSEETRILVLTP